MNVEVIAKTGERIIQAGEKAFKLISKESRPLEALERLSLPKDVAYCEEILIGGKNSAGKDIFIKMCSDKDVNGKVLGRAIKRTEDGKEIFNKIQDYKYYGENSRFIDTKIYDSDFKLLSSQQETMKLDTNPLFDKPIVTRTSVTKNNINGKASQDTHFWGEFQNISENERALGVNNKELKFNFQRNKEGFMASPLTYEKTTYGIDTSNPFITTYAANKDDVIHDFIQINAKEKGFSEMPKVEIFNERPNKNGDLTGGDCGVINLHFSTDLNTKETILTDVTTVFPTIRINGLTDKLKEVESAGHEVKHLCQYRETIDDELISKMEEPTKSFWDKERLTTINPEKAERYIEGFYEGGKNEHLFELGFITPQEHYEKYFNNITEVEARETGAKAKENYEKNLNAFKRVFPFADWGRLMA